MNTPITYKEYQEALAICNNYLRQEKDVSLIEVDMSVSLHKCLEILLRLNQVENLHTITLRIILKF